MFIHFTFPLNFSWKQKFESKCVYTFSPWKSNLYAPLIPHTNIPVDADIPSGVPFPVIGLFLTWLYVTVFHPLEELVILVLQQSRFSYFLFFLICCDRFLNSKIFFHHIPFLTKVCRKLTIFSHIWKKNPHVPIFYRAYKRTNTKGFLASQCDVGN